MTQVRIWDCPGDSGTVGNYGNSASKQITVYLYLYVAVKSGGETYRQVVEGLE